MMANKLTLIISDPTLPTDMKMEVDHGNGFEDNAERRGWQKEIAPPQSSIDAALQKVIDAKEGSPERLKAQQDLQVLQTSRIPNPESPLQYLMGLVSDFIHELTEDVGAKELRQKQALAAVEEEFKQKREVRIKVTPVPRTPAE